MATDEQALEEEADQRDRRQESESAVFVAEVRSSIAGMPEMLA